MAVRSRTRKAGSRRAAPKVQKWVYLGDAISIDGTTGEVFAGELPSIAAGGFLPFPPQRTERGWLWLALLKPYASTGGLPYTKRPV